MTRVKLKGELFMKLVEILKRRRCPAKMNETAISIQPAINRLKSGLNSYATFTHYCVGYWPFKLARQSVCSFERLVDGLKEA